MFPLEYNVRTEAKYQISHQNSPNTSVLFAMGTTCVLKINHSRNIKVTSPKHFFSCSQDSLQQRSKKYRLVTPKDDSVIRRPCGSTPSSVDEPPAEAMPFLPETRQDQPLVDVSYWEELLMSLGLLKM